MRNKYSTGFFICAAAALCAVTYANQFSYHRAKERLAQVQEEETEQGTREVKKTEDSVATKGEALKEDCYYLMEVNGYVVVYLSDRETPYEYTNILYDELPDRLRDEIRNGKYIESTEELYGFLENYSS